MFRRHGRFQTAIGETGVEELLKATIDTAIATKAIKPAEFQAVVRDLLARHYDPGYAASTQRNFTHFDAALPVVLPDRSPATLARAAAGIQASEK